MIIVSEADGGPRVVAISATPRPAITEQRADLDGDPSAAVTVEIEAAESADAFRARMVAEHAGAGVRHIVVTAEQLPQNVPPERWVVDWATGTIAVAGPGMGDLLAHAAACRWRRQTGGIMVAGLPVRTDDKTRIEIGLARADATADPGWTTRWKLANGQFVSINATAIAGIAEAVSLHLRDCFAREDRAAAGIAAGSITTLAEVEACFA